MFLFDTDTLSQVLRREPPPSLLVRLAAIPAEEQFTSAITIGEMVYGAHRSPRPEHFLGLLRERVLNDVVVLPFDQAAGEAYGRLRAELERAGTPIGEADTRIAAIALTHDLTVVTGNLRHFSRVPGLRVENWI
jgi:predicted nucleic acid-binding protein